MDIKGKTSFYIFLNSSDRSSYSAENSNTRFVNLLGETIHLPSSQGWCVALKSLTCSNTLQPNRQEQKSAGLIKVKTNLIQPTLGQEKILAVCTREVPNAIRDRLIHFEPKNKSFFPISGDLLSAIDITLVDIEDRQLQFTLAAPTLVVLEFRKMSDKSEFTIRVNSQDDKEGSGTDFEVELPPMLSHNPNQKWNVSLSSMIYDGKFDPIPLTEEEKTITVQFLDMVEGDAKVKNIDVQLPLTNTGEGTTMENNGEFAKNVKLALKKIEFTKEQANLDTNQLGLDESKSQLFHTMLFNPETEMFKFAVKKPTNIYIPYRLAVMLGSTKEPNADGKVFYALPINELFNFEEPVRFNIWVPTFLLLYCNFIEYSHIGSALAPILKIIPIHLNREEREFNTYESPSPELHRVTYSQLTNLKFKLKTVDGRDAPFNSKKGTTVLTLKFTKQ